MHEPHEELPAALAATARRLQDERSTLTGLELDQIKLRAERRAARPDNTFLSRQRRALMKSRMAITSLLVLGVLVSGTGTGLAISGVSDSGSAGSAQYPGAAAQNDKPDVLGDEETGEDAGVAGAQESGRPGGAGGAGGGNDDVQATRQVAVQDGDDTLPFTGLAAIPLILIGLTLLVAGVMMHRRLPESV